MYPSLKIRPSVCVFNLVTHTLKVTSWVSSKKECREGAVSPRQEPNPISQKNLSFFILTQGNFSVNFYTE